MVPGIVDVVVVLSGDPEAPTGPEKATASVAQVTSAPSAGPRRGGVPRGGGVEESRRSRRRAVRPTQPGTDGTRGNVARAERPARRMTFEMWRPRGGGADRPRRRQHSGRAPRRRPGEHGPSTRGTRPAALSRRASRTTARGTRSLASLGPVTSTATRRPGHRLLAVCTGNVARSPLLAAMVEARDPAWRTRSAGTHASGGQAVSARTLAAWAAVTGLPDRALRAHRSQGLDADLVAWADLVVAVEADQVRALRRAYPEAAGRVASLAQLLAEPGDLAAITRDLASREPSSAFDVADPAGGDARAYERAARRLWDLAGDLVAR